jgi:hypothetical protein
MHLGLLVQLVLQEQAPGEGPQSCQGWQGTTHSLLQALLLC